MAWMRTRIDLPEQLSSGDRELVLDEVTDFIRKRTQKGKDKNNKAFPRYSKDYKASLDFRNAGKSSKVNLTLSGDMLAAMDILSHKKGSGLIGYENGTEENSRAEGNIKGTYGQRSSIPGKKRDFLGIAQKDLDKIINKPSIIEKLSIDVSSLPGKKLKVSVGQ